MRTHGITWHAVTVQPDQFEAQKAFVANSFGMAPAHETDGFAMFRFENGTVFEINVSVGVTPDGSNDDLSIGWRVDDVAEARDELARAGYPPVGDIVRLPKLNYAYCHFRGPGGRVYGLNESKPQHPRDPTAG